MLKQDDTSTTTPPEETTKSLASEATTATRHNHMVSNDARAQQPKPRQNTSSPHPPSNIPKDADADKHAAKTSVTMRNTATLQNPAETACDEETATTE